MNSNHISIITYNAGLLSVKVPFREDWVFTPYVNERLKALPQQIENSGADIIAIQEIYELSHQEFLFTALDHIYPYHTSSNKKRILGLNADGLIILSKFPIQKSSFHIFNKSFWLERIFVLKGFLVAKIALSADESLCIINTHLTAGGLKHPEAKKSNSVRAKQILQLQEYAQQMKGPCVMLGDFNAGMATANESRSYVSKINYQSLLSKGWHSALELAKSVYPQNPNEQITWDAKNILNIDSPHGEGQDSPSPSQLIDHILLDTFAEQKYSIEKASIVFQEPVVKIEGTATVVTSSDHYGLLVRIKNRASFSSAA